MATTARIPGRGRRRGVAPWVGVLFFVAFVAALLVAAYTR